MNLQGQVALVTGSARRVGRAIAGALAAAGADIVIHHHASPDAARSTAEELSDLGVRTLVLQADLTDLSEIDRLFQSTERTFGRLDILVNSAAILQRRPALEIDGPDWDAVMNLNLRAPFFCSRWAARLMGDVGGKIVNIADVAAFQPWPAYAHHSISKAGLVMATRVLARALAPRIQVNAVAPGPVLPPEEFTDEERRRIAEGTVLKRLGAPSDVADAVLFLIRSDYITGETILVDGGKMLLSGG